jgi:hypothetical protein
MAGFVYNPAESIKQDFQQTASGLGNIFAQVIQQQQRDYTLAENTFANIEALKKDLNIYGQKSISSKANALLGNASSAILANGKLDYDKLGEIRQAVSDIKDLKTGYDLGSKEYERMLQMGLANKENLTSFEGFYKDLSAKMSDENLIKNPRDLQAALADTYTKSLDATKMFGKAYLSANPYQKVAYDVKDPKTGAMMRVQGELPAGWTIDAAGNKIPPKSVTVTNPDGTTSVVDAADQTLAQIKASNPDVLMAMRRQAGFAGENMSDKQLVQYYTSKVPMASQVQQIASADELLYKKAAADKAAFDAKNQEEEWAMKKKLIAAQIANYQEQSGGSGSSWQPKSLADLSIEVNEKGKSATFGGEGIKIDVYHPTRRSEGLVPFKAINVRTLPNGTKQVGGYFLDADNKPRNPQAVYINFDKNKNVQNSLNSSINKMGKEDRLYHQTQLFNFDNVQIPQSTTTKLTAKQIGDINAVRKNPANAEAVKGMSDLEVWNLMQQQ